MKSSSIAGANLLNNISEMVGEHVNNIVVKIIQKLCGIAHKIASSKDLLQI